MLRTMQRPAVPHHHAYGRPASLTARNQSTSSAFSPSAHPHEDWTKITDLAERRRIQNRIAQRNYRKKLKRKFEDLERRAATTGDKSGSSRKKDVKKQPKPRSPSQPSLSLPPPPAPALAPVPVSEPHISFLSMAEDPIFLDQFSKTVSMSPPASYAYPAVSMEPFSYSAYTSALSGPAMVSSATYPPMSAYHHSFPTPFPSPVQSVEYPVKPDVYTDVGLSNFGMTFASIPNIESTAGPFDHLPQTPPLSESFESTCQSPDSSIFGYPTLPSPTTPPQFFQEHEWA